MHTQENCLVFQAGAPSAEDGYKDTQRILENSFRKIFLKSFSLSIIF